MNMFEWEEDNFSFEDSDRFEEVSKDYQNIVQDIRPCNNR